MRLEYVRYDGGLYVCDQRMVVELARHRDRPVRVRLDGQADQVFELEMIDESENRSRLDVRAQDELAADPRLIPGAQHRDPEALMSSAARFERQSVIVVCQEGLQLSQGVSAWMRHHGIAAQTLEGGFAAWRADGQLLIPAERVPARDSQGRTVWVTRARPKIVRIA